MKKIVLIAIILSNFSVFAEECTPKRTGINSVLWAMHQFYRGIDLAKDGPFKIHQIAADEFNGLVIQNHTACEYRLVSTKGKYLTTLPAYSGYLIKQGAEICEGMKVYE